MALFEAYLTPKQSGQHTFKMDNRDDRQAMWLDINQNGVFELAEGEKLGNAPWDVNNIKVNLEAGHSYKFAMLHGEYGGGTKFRSRITAPGLSQRVIKPDNAQVCSHGLYYLTARMSQPETRGTTNRFSKGRKVLTASTPRTP